jgi:hypothetical protein
MLAEAYGHLGQPEEGLRVLAESMGHLSQPEERLGEAELYRLTGELRRHTTVCRPASAGCSPHDTWALPASPEACFLQALAIARRQQAKVLELRAAVSLSRLWQQQGKRAEARALLAPIYGWFTEGFDTADLQEAKTLLDELGA